MKIYLLAGIVSTLLSIILGFITIPILKKLKLGQNVLSYVDKHKNKNGTVTMGGVFFMLAIIITFILFAKTFSKISIMALTVSVAFAIVGFLDDFIKVKFSRNLGLTAIQKTVFMLVVSLLASIFSFRQGLDFVFLPFFNNSVYLGGFSVLLSAFVFISTVNGANLTDGLDGLCASVSVIVFLAFAVIISLQMSLNGSLYLVSQEYENLVLLSVIFAGSLLGYLVFNVNKAIVFMGDTGSLAIGGAVGSIAIFSGNALFIPFVCVVYLISALSVIIQVLHFKRTKNRVFKMAPFHHHLELLGKTEWQISYYYSLSTLIISLILIVFILR